MYSILLSPLFILETNGKGQKVDWWCWCYLQEHGECFTYDWYVLDCWSYISSLGHFQRKKYIMFIRSKI